jgi:resuscitation-promoting factor RpfB
VRRVLKYVLYSVVLAGVVGGTVAWSRVDKTVMLRVDGEGRSIHTTSATVRGVLADAKVTTGAHDIVAPALPSEVHNGSQIVVKRGRLLHLVVDGRKLDIWVTTPTVAEALDELGYSTADFSSVSRDRRLPLSPTDIELRTPRTVTVVADGKTRIVTTTDASVRQLLHDLGIATNPTDRISVALDSWPQDGGRIVLQRVTAGRLVERRAVPFPTTTQQDPSAPVGQTTVVAPGHAGIQQLTYAVVYLDGKLIGKTLVARTAVLAPVPKLVKVGTKQPTPAAAPTTPAQTPTTDTAPISVDPSSAQGIARQLLADRGMGDDQFSCLVQMWNNESGWRVNAQNASSGAYGIPQALPGSKMAAYGADWQTNPRTQILWGLAYIQGRYGTPCQAWASWQSQGWY